MGRFLNLCARCSVSKAFERGRKAKEFWSSRNFTIHLLRQNPLTVFGLVVVVVFIMLGLVGQLTVPYDPVALDPGNSLMPPSFSHPFGTDGFGRDIFSRIIAGARVDASIALAAVALSFVIGTSLGAIAGYFRGALEEVIMRIMDVLQGFPPFILAMGLAAALGPGIRNVILVVAVIMVPMYARLVRSEMLSVRERAYADAARCMGASDFEIVFIHLMPNCLVPVMVQSALSVSWAILDAAGLSFLGLGVRPPVPEWGAMISEGIEYLVTGGWWVSFFPGLAIFITVLGFNLLADGLRDILDPRLRS